MESRGIFRQRFRYGNGYHQKSLHHWLVAWNMNFMTFHILGITIPTDELIFFAGVETTNQINQPLCFGQIGESNMGLPWNPYQLWGWPISVPTLKLWRSGLEPYCGSFSEQECKAQKKLGDCLDIWISSVCDPSVRIKRFERRLACHMSMSHIFFSSDDPLYEQNKIGISCALGCTSQISQTWSKGRI